METGPRFFVGAKRSWSDANRAKPSGCVNTGTTMQRHYPYNTCPDILINAASVCAGFVINAMTWRTARGHVRDAQKIGGKGNEKISSRYVGRSYGIFIYSV